MNKICTILAGDFKDQRAIVLSFVYNFHLDKVVAIVSLSDGSLIQIDIFKIKLLN